MANDTASIDWTKPILWDGEPARVLATDIKGEWPVAVVLTREIDGTEYVAGCDLEGRRHSGASFVTNAPERVERWANVYGGEHAVSPDLGYDKRTADECALDGRTALVRYTFENDKLVDVAIVPLEDKP